MGAPRLNTPSPCCRTRTVRICTNRVRRAAPTSTLCQRTHDFTLTHDAAAAGQLLLLRVPVWQCTYRAHTRSYTERLERFGAWSEPGHLQGRTDRLVSSHERPWMRRVVQRERGVRSVWRAGACAHGHSGGSMNMPHAPTGRANRVGQEPSRR